MKMFVLRSSSAAENGRVLLQIPLIRGSFYKLWFRHLRNRILRHSGSCSIEIIRTFSPVARLRAQRAFRSLQAGNPCQKTGSWLRHSHLWARPLPRRGPGNLFRQACRSRDSSTWPIMRSRPHSLQTARLAGERLLSSFDDAPTTRERGSKKAGLTYANPSRHNAGNS